MDSRDPVPCAERLRAALEMHELGVSLMRQNLRRCHPMAPEARIDADLARWLRAPDAGSTSR